ncbi:phage tail tape measure protein [Providencia rettgeri]|uniref:phage tail tape measure protein n=3 Tax=Providencia rettgeri TaxID=587 RepID=UPI0019D4770E|nr:phage tail tape measure protein [Providencia rettgeri]MBN7840867.1 phage tail tape measure protein [Providencia rettgeri]MBN7855040.1 phage tail tape measure protein [Providencia rettgeri]MBN7860951.1 phage tail tape measure protein [Providencia rettgeri]MBN7871706.1 phage tail tape measure protein [Providencia rettgeri]MBN7897317.1 phage tail tape measure protein [Providencia rettgeri]
MSNQIADLEIKIGANTTEFLEKAGRVERELNKQERDDQRFAKMRQDALDRIAAKESERQRKRQSQLKQFSDASAAAHQQKISELEAEARAVEKNHIDVKRIFEEEMRKGKRPESNTGLVAQYDAQMDALQKYNKGLEEAQAIRQRLNRDLQNGLLVGKEYATLQNRIGGIIKTTTRAEEEQTQAKQRFINKLKEQVTQQNLSRTEMLRIQAAQLGVSSSADVYIRKLEKQNVALKGVTISSGQYRQAMRQLPMQMTDIVTSLASGMPPWLVAVQQGGQIKDSFGGFGNSLKAITSLITPWKVAMFGGAGALTAFGVAAYQGSKELSEYNKQLILTGNYAAKTKGQLNELARSLSGDGITQYKMADALAQVVGSGSFTGSQVDMVAGVAAKMEKATGQSIDETIKQFQRLKDQPVQAVMELDKSLHFLTATQLEQITTLEEQGRTSDAAKIAMESYANSMRDRTSQIVENLGYLESAWNWVGDAAKDAIDKMRNLGRDLSVEDEISRLEDYITRFDNSIYTFGMDERKQRLAALKETKFQNDIKAAREKADRNEEERKKRTFNADQKLKRDYEKAEEKHQRRLNEIKNSGGSKNVIDEAIKREEIRYKKELARETPKKPKGKAFRPDMGTRNDESAQAEVTSLQAQLKLLEQHSSTTDFISQQRKNLQLEQAKFDVLEEASKTRKLSLDEQSLLKNKESILANKMKLADLGDQISKQEHLNKLQDQADKYVKQQEARQKAIADSLGKSSLELQRALEIEQLRSTYGNTPQWEKVEGAKLSTFAQEDAAKQDWAAGMKTAWGDYRDAALDANAQIQSVTSATLNGFSSTLSSVLVDGQANFKDFTKSILKMLAEIAIKMSIVKGFEAFGFGGVTANAKGGVYNSPGLSAYSGQIVSQPTLFPFARGAGLMGEAGPEAILPLRRGIDGKLGVIAGNAKQSSGDFYQTNHVTIQNDGSNGEIGPQALKAVYEVGKKGAEDYLRSQRRDGGSFSA